MRIKETTSKNGREELIYEIKLGFPEVQALFDVIVDARKRLPNAIEITSFRNRLTNMVKVLTPTVKSRKLK